MEDGENFTNSTSSSRTSNSTDTDNDDEPLYYPPDERTTTGLVGGAGFSLQEEPFAQELILQQDANSTASSLDVQVDDIIYDIEDVMMLSLVPAAADGNVDGGGDLEIILGT